MPKVKLPEGEGAVKPDGRAPQVVVDLRVKLERLATYRMFEVEPFGVQPEAMAGDRSAVQRVRVNGMPDGREVDPDLVRPPRLEPYAQHRMFCCSRKHLELRDGRLPYARGHEGGVVGVTADGGVDRPRPGQAFVLYDRPVDAGYPPGRHHPDETGVRRLAFREHHQA